MALKNPPSLNHLWGFWNSYAPFNTYWVFVKLLTQVFTSFCHVIKFTYFTIIHKLKHLPIKTDKQTFKWITAQAKQWATKMNENLILVLQRFSFFFCTILCICSARLFRKTEVDQLQLRGAAECLEWWQNVSRELIKGHPCPHFKAGLLPVLFKSVLPSIWALFSFDTKMIDRKEMLFKYFFFGLRAFNFTKYCCLFQDLI